jgi:hypothetical protein
MSLELDACAEPQGDTAPVVSFTTPVIPQFGANVTADTIGLRAKNDPMRGL